MGLIHSSAVSSHAHAPGRSSVLAHGTMQMAVTMLFGIALPLIVYGLAIPSALTDKDIAQLTIALSMAATFAAVLVLTRMIRYPGVSHAGTILPTLGSAYGIVFATLLILREPYSNSILLLCFTGSAVVQYVIAARLRQTANPLHYIVPGGHAAAITRVRGCNSQSGRPPTRRCPRAHSSSPTSISIIMTNGNGAWPRLR